MSLNQTTPLQISRDPFLNSPEEDEGNDDDGEDEDEGARVRTVPRTIRTGMK